MERRHLLDRVRDSGVSWRLLLAATGYGAALATAEALWSLSDRAPLWSGLATDLLMLLFVAAVVDSVVARRERAKVDLVARIMYRSLAQLAFDGRRGLDALLTGTDLRAAGVPGWDDDLVTGTRRVLAGAGPADPRPLDDRSRGPRLAALLHDHDFTVLLYRELSVQAPGPRRHRPMGADHAAHQRGGRRPGPDAGARRRPRRPAPDRLPRGCHGAAPRGVDGGPGLGRGRGRPRGRVPARGRAGPCVHHGLAEERRRLGQAELDAAQAVTQQPPLYLSSARRRHDDEPADPPGAPSHGRADGG